MPGNQDRGNSGVYIFNNYETQILDSFGIKGEFNFCSALYRKKAPDLNMCLPPLAWQTYDIEFTAPAKDPKKIETPVLRPDITEWLFMTITNSTKEREPGAAA